MTNARTVMAAFSLCCVLVSSGRQAAAAEAEATQAKPTPGVSAAQMEKNKAVVREFFRDGITARERYDLLDEHYLQHNPAAAKLARQQHLSYKESFLKMLESMGGSFPSPPAQIDGVPVPRGNPLYMLLAEGDLVFVMRQEYRKDPTEATTQFYPSYGWDVFRVCAGKLCEHWDGATINPRPPGDHPNMH